MDESGFGLTGRSGFRAALKKLINHVAGTRGTPLTDVRVAFVDGKAMRRLKKEFFGKDMATDVLSFPDGSGGDIAVCPQVVWKDAERDGRDSGEYLAEVLIHGTLHLKGLTHDYKPATLQALWKKQARLLKESRVSTHVFRAE